MKKRIILGGFCAYLFTGSSLYSFVYDVEPSSHIIDEYLQEVTDSGEPISLQEWMDRQDDKVSIGGVINWLGDQCDAAFNPWYESNPTAGPHHREGD